jgi:hypothetical protein
MDSVATPSGEAPVACSEAIPKRRGRVWRDRWVVQEQHRHSFIIFTVVEGRTRQRTTLDHLAPENTETRHGEKVGRLGRGH